MDAAKRQRYEKIAEGLTMLSGGKDNIQVMSLGDLKTVANRKMNPLQRIIKALSDVFVDIMPGILAAPLLTGLSGVLGNLDFVHNNAALFGVNLLCRYPLLGGCIGGAGCLTHGDKNKAEVDKYGREAFEKTISDAISMLK